MTTRYITWHIPSPGSPTPVYYIDRDSEATALRIYAENAPNGGDMIVDILDDGVSIMHSNNYEKINIKSENAYIEFGTHTGTFTVNETVTGGTSGATAKVLDNKFGRLTLILDSPSTTVFTVGETITGGSSSATGIVDAYVRQTRSGARTVVAGNTHAVLPKNSNTNDAADDFIDKVQVAEGSWLSLSVLAENGANKVTVQLELTALSESVEARHWAE